MKLFLLLIASIFTVLANAQLSDTMLLSDAKDTVFADFTTVASSNGTTFQAQLPPRKGMVGGRAPFYSYLWDFGDGHFSYQKLPTHQYAKQGNYEASLYVVNNYDDGPRPPRRPKLVKIDASQASSVSTIDVAEQQFFSSNGVFQIAKNTNALPGQDMTLIVGVKHVGKGRVFLLTNEKTFDNEGLAFLNQTTYNNEKKMPTPIINNLQSMWASINRATVTYSGSPDYGIKEELHFDKNEADQYFSQLYNSYKTISDYEVNSSDGAAQFSLINLKATPEMLADTNAIITITGVFLPADGGLAVIHKVEVPVVTSHDPNNMSMKNARSSYRFLSKHKKLVYKVKFQNDGVGDAKNIWLKMALPKEADISTFKLLSLYPYCDSCKSEKERGCWILKPQGMDTLVFHFKDISLPGTQAEDISDPDSTKGFIRFSVNTNKKLANKPYKARTLIYFDKNEPIKTNRATGRFNKGISPIVFAGYNSFMPVLGKDTNTYSEQLMLGVGIAPIAPYKKLYFQFEAYGNISKYLNTTKVNDPGTIAISDSGIGRKVEYTSYTSHYTSKDLNVRIVPLHLRYNFNQFVAAGVGALTQFKVNINANADRTYDLINTNGAADTYTKSLGAWQNNPNKDFKIIPFLDITVGRVYLGPSLGLRYYYEDKNLQYLNLYLAWRL